MTTFEWLYYAASAWTLAYAITHTHGPFGVFEAPREWRGGRWHGRTWPTLYIVTNQGTEEVKDGLLDCIICLMPWLALLLRLVGPNLITDALAIAGVALWLHGFTGWRHTIN